MRTVTYVTGAGGFVGRHLIGALHRAGHTDTHRVGRSSGLTSYDELLSMPLAGGSAIVHLAGKAHDLKNVSATADYDIANFQLTQRLYDAFRISDAAIFIFISSIKAVADDPEGPITEQTPAEPGTAYGRSKLKAEQYILGHPARPGQRVYVLRPCVIHGAGVKGNIRLLERLVTSGVPYPLGAFHNLRSLLSVENLVYVILALVARDAPSGVYNVADDEPLSTVEIVELIAHEHAVSARVLKVPPRLVMSLARIGDRARLPFNSERLGKLTGNYVVSNEKIKTALSLAHMPTMTRDGLRRSVSSAEAERSGEPA